jgi:hypothetical protein
MNAVELMATNWTQGQGRQPEPLDLQTSANPIASGAATPAVLQALAEAGEYAAVNVLRGACTYERTGFSQPHERTHRLAAPADTPLSVTSLLELVV